MNVTDAPVNPAAASPARYSDLDSAPAMHPTYDPAAALSAALRWSSATTSETPIRPPGTSTRNISARTAGLSVDRLITQLEITTSTDASGSGTASIWPLRNVTLPAPAWAAFAWASDSISSVMSTP